MTESQPTLTLPGEVIELEGQKVRVHEGPFAPKTPLMAFEVLHEIEGVCAFVGRKSEAGKVMDAFPIFTGAEYGRELTAVAAGLVLFADLARDFEAQNRTCQNFTVAHLDDIEQHALATYGSQTVAYIQHAFIGRRLGGDNAKFLAKRLLRLLKLNYPNAALLLERDNRRLLLKSPFKRLAVVDDNRRFKDFAAMALYLGELWLEAVDVLLATSADFGDRTGYLLVDPSQPLKEAA